MSRNNQKPYSGAYFHRRFSNFSTNANNGDYGLGTDATGHTVRCASGQPEMGAVRLEVANTGATLGTSDLSHTVTNRDGSVSYPAGTWLKAIAEPIQGFHFVRWETNLGDSGGKAANPLQFKLTKDTVITAHFAKNSNGSVTKTVNVHWDGAMGRVTGTGNFTLGGGSPANSGSLTATSGSSVTLTAAANQGYHFVKWQGTPIAGKTANPVTFNVSADCNVSALFAKDENHGGTSDDEEPGGHVIDPGGGGGGGSNPPTPEQPVIPGNDLTAQVTAFVKIWWWAILIVGYIVSKERAKK